MSHPASPDFSYWSHLVRDAVAGRRWVCTGDALPPVARAIRQLRALGSGPCFGIATSRGAGDASFADGDQKAVLNVVAADMMGGIHASEAALQALPKSVRDALDTFDPERSAQVVGPLFAQASTVAGRRLLGARALPWRQLEDKTIIDDVWDAAGVTRAPFRVVPATPGDLADAAAAVDQGHGTVWSADNRDGWYGGAARVRWIRRRADIPAAAEWFAGCADSVRVMPFLDGLPCSIHGLVLPTHVAALRPAEMLVLRRPDDRFHYARAATFWDPPAADRAYMRDFARQVGAHLRATVGYRGAFTVDGIMTRRGFRPTELNPRYGAALSVMFDGLTELPLYLLNLLITEGLDVDWRAADLETALLARADTRRSGGCNAMTARRVTAQDNVALMPHGASWRVARPGEDPHVTAALGPASSGGYARVTLCPAHTPVGRSAAPRVASVLSFLDQHWDLGIGPLNPAPDVRTPASA